MNWYKRQLKIAKRIWTDDDLQTIKELLEEGYPLDQIGELVGMSAVTMSRLNKEYGLVDFEAKKIEKDKWIKGLYLLPPDGEGLSSKQISKQYGIPIKSIKRALKRFDLLDQYRDRSWYDSPENKKRLSEIATERQNDPAYKGWMSEMQKQRYIDNPDLHRQRSEQLKKVHLDNPQLAIDSAKRMQKRWDDFDGDFEDWVSTFPPERQQSIRDAVNATYRTRV